MSSGLATPIAGEEPAPLRDLPRLTSLRAFAALAVLGYHLMRHTDLLPHDDWFRYGFTGVGFFFILSGFVLTWSIRPHDGARDFWVRRFARVYPSHFVMLVVAVVVPVAPGAITWLGAVAGLLLVQAWFVDWDVVFGLNSPSWTLSCEAFFYLCAPFVIRRLASASRTRAVVVAGAWVVATSAASVGLGLSSNGADVYAYHNPLIRSGEFVLGVLLAVLVEKGWRPRLPLVGCLALLLIVAGVLSVGPSHLQQSVADVVLAPFFALVILSAALADLGGRRGLLQRRTLTYLGQVSFAFYLVHELVIVNLIPHLPIETRIDHVISLAVILVAALGSALALHHLVELPCQGGVRRWWSRRRTRAGVSPTSAKP
jgi:peptidoglycan/LPS O-acetylase OafA/YrhL